ncbi:hypothetical protein BT96DRAFT_1009696 [Gymnopus androsaceus JB14]|uniref:Uncharacterized protein n=1 Tax=Gymnopus androsaceus JB14 TaxID=1447944 RepID=A0A6A4GCB7_9AGAR|nr:hypothetical protein BT96DRAFT_1009696 [Gymnopus androsaceus JB14]
MTAIISVVETKFNLAVEAIPQAICPECGYVCPLTYPNSLSKPEWPERCSYRVTKLSEPCGESLLKSDGQPRKMVENYPFSDWFGRFLSLPGIEQFAQHYGLLPSTKYAGDLFIANRGEECHRFFLHTDLLSVGVTYRLREETSITTLARLNLRIPTNQLILTSQCNLMVERITFPWPWPYFQWTQKLLASHPSGVSPPTTVVAAVITPLPSPPPPPTAKAAVTKETCSLDPQAEGKRRG